jgi:hypothetical protein
MIPHSKAASEVTFTIPVRIGVSFAFSNDHPIK